MEWFSPCPCGATRTTAARCPGWTILQMDHAPMITRTKIPMLLSATSRLELLDLPTKNMKQSYSPTCIYNTEITLQIDEKMFFNVLYE